MHPLLVKMEKHENMIANKVLPIRKCHPKTKALHSKAHYVNVFMHACMSVYVCTCVRVCMYVCMWKRNNKINIAFLFYQQ